MSTKPPLSPVKQALATIERLTAKLDRLEAAAREPVAIVGIGCRFPGGVRDVAGYWSLLAEGRDAIGPLPPDRAGPGGPPAPEGGYLDDVDAFDPALFGIPTVEAAAMDPQQRLVLEVAWEALENACIPSSSLAGSPVGVFMGVAGSDWREMVHADPASIGAFTGTGASHSVLSGRLAYLLDLRGPAVSVDTACSSSLATVHMAVRALRAGDCDMALAGGVNLMLAPEGMMAIEQMGLLSPSRRCRPFDTGGDGIVLGEGCGVVALKRLSDALEHGDRIHAVVRGAGMNQDGRSTGLTAPNGTSQRDALCRALRDAGVAPKDVCFIETHGTGTPLGDPIEIDALAAIYGEGGAPCHLGAVKSNVGHLAAAAGIAGLIKAALVVSRREVPGNLHLARINPEIDLAGTRLRISDRPAVLPDTGSPARAAVSSFGWSGTNVHVVLEAAPDARDREDDAPVAAPAVLPLSAEAGALDGMVTAWRRALSDPRLLGPIPATRIAGSAAFGRDALPARAVAWGSSAAELATTLTIDPSGAMPDDARRWLLGHAVDWGAAGLRRHVLDLPLYAWNRQRFAMPVRPERRASAGVDHTPGGPTLRVELEALPPTEHEAALARHIQGLVAGLLGMGGPDAVPLDAGFTQLGLTSLGALDLHQALEKELGTGIPRTIAFEGFTVRRAVAMLLEGPLATLDGKGAAPAEAKATAGEPASLAGSVSGLADDLEAMLDRLDGDRGR
ncbi:MAG: beta-ketoacyl synthase N-terminal-like domain-containing protein [Pseudomonadota bacterium]